MLTTYYFWREQHSSYNWIETFIISSLTSHAAPIGALVSNKVGRVKKQETDRLTGKVICRYRSA